LSLKNILFTTDFSAVSETAVPHVLALARWYGSKVFVAHIVPPEPRLGVPLDPLPIDSDYNWQAAERKMERYVQNHVFEQVSHRFVLKQGELGNVLPDIIRQHDIELIVLGTHGRHGITKMVLGSTAEQIFRTATCPVLTVGPKAAKWPAELETLKRVLFATDFSAGSLHALPYALSLAEENQAVLILLHLIPLMPIEEHREAVQAGARQRLEALVPAEATAWCEPEFAVGFEPPAEGILRVAEEQKADVIVMGVHRARSPRLVAHAPWATAYQVVCRAPCPVLTVRD
jgi:nucleotide-binding universal stress UspA family protein